jgi:hypothetical protein
MSGATATHRSSAHDRRLSSCQPSCNEPSVSLPWGLQHNNYAPGVVERLEGLTGTYLPVPWAPTRSPPKRGGMRAINMSLAYHAHARDVRIDMRLTLEVTPDSRRITTHSYHLGPYARSDEYFVRLCENLNQPYHFHLHGWEKAYGGGHIPANRAIPPLSRDPLDFLDVVEHFIKTKQIKIQVKQ